MKEFKQYNARTKFGAAYGLFYVPVRVKLAVIAEARRLGVDANELAVKLLEEGLNKPPSASGA